MERVLFLNDFLVFPGGGISFSVAKASRSKSTFVPPSNLSRQGHDGKSLELLHSSLKVDWRYIKSLYNHCVFFLSSHSIEILTIKMVPTSYRPLSSNLSSASSGSSAGYSVGRSLVTLPLHSEFFASTLAHAQSAVSYAVFCILHRRQL